MGRHGGRGMTVAAMVGECMVYLVLPTYIPFRRQKSSLCGVQDFAYIGNVET